MEVSTPTAPPKIDTDQLSQDLEAYAKQREFQEYLAQKKPHIKAQIEAAAKKRRDIEEDLKTSFGLIVLAPGTSCAGLTDEAREQLVKDNLEKDIEGHTVAATVRVYASSEDEIIRCYEAAKKHNLAVETRGGNTSGIGLFDMEERARRDGFDGVLLIECPLVEWDGARSMEAHVKAAIAEKKGKPIEKVEPHDILELPDPIPSGFTLIKHPKYPIAILKNETDPWAHEYIAHPMTSIHHVNLVLCETLGEAYRCMVDITSYKDATLGGTAAAGGGGATRESLAGSVIELRSVNRGRGLHTLDKKESKKVIGNNGYTGTITQLRMGVTPFPPHEGMTLVAVKGATEEEAWDNAMKLQQRLKQHMIHPGKLKDMDPKPQTIVTGLELLGSEQLKNSIANKAQETGENNVNDPVLMEIANAEGSMIVVQVKTASYTDWDDITELLDENALEPGTTDRMDPVLQGIGLTSAITVGYPTLITVINEKPEEERTEAQKTLSHQQDVFRIDTVFWTALQEVFDEQVASADAPSADMEALLELKEGLLSQREGHENVPIGSILHIKNESTRKHLEAVRHDTPDVEKRIAEVAGFSQTFDIGFIVNGTPEQEAKVYALMGKAVAHFRNTVKKLPVRTAIYGHLPNGMSEPGEGGGFCPHLRVTVQLTDPASRLCGPETIITMKDAQKKLYEQLYAIAAHYPDSTHIEAPEKNKLTNTAYIRYLATHEPEKFEAMRAAIIRNGSPECWFRTPFELPPDLPMHNGETIGIRDIFSFLNPDLLDHEALARDPGDPQAIHKASINFSQLSHRSGQGEAHYMVACQQAEAALGVYRHKQSTGFIDPGETEHILAQNFGKDWQAQGWKIDRSVRPKPGQFGSCPHDPKTIYEVNCDDLGIPNGLSIIIFPIEALQEAVKRNDADRLSALTANGGPKPERQNRAKFRNLEEIHMARILGKPEETNKIDQLTKATACFQAGRTEPRTFSKDTRRIVTGNPGPAMLDVQEYPFITSVSAAQQAQDTIDIKSYLDIPNEHKLACFGSSTRCMQAYAEVLAGHPNTNVVQVGSGDFALKWGEIMIATGVPVTGVNTPRLTSPASFLDKVIPGIIAGFKKEKENVLCLTPHETSTNTSYDPMLIVHALRQKGWNDGEHYHLVCDITSGAGGIKYDHNLGHKYQTGENGTTAGHTSGMSSFFSVQKGLKGTAGNGIAPIDRHFYNTFVSNNPTSALEQAVAQTANGANPFSSGIHCLAERCREEISQSVTVEQVQEQSRRKMLLVLAFAALCDGLDSQVPDFRDTSDILAGLLSKLENLKQVRIIMETIFETLFIVGGGYNIFSSEAIRILVDAIEEEDLMELLAYLHEALQMNEARLTKKQEAPVASLREAHRILKTLRAIQEQFRLRRFLDSKPALEWASKMMATWMDGVGLVESNAPKRTLYTSDQQLRGMEKVLFFAGADETARPRWEQGPQSQLLTNRQELLNRDDTLIAVYNSFRKEQIRLEEDLASDTPPSEAAVAERMEAIYPLFSAFVEMVSDFFDREGEEAPTPLVNGHTMEDRARAAA